MRRYVVPLALLCCCGAAVAAAARKGPPPLVLTSKAGRQVAVSGSFCVQDSHGGLCGDTADPEPKRLSIVRPRETIRIAVPGATSLVDTDCGPAPCTSDVRVYRLGCDNGPPVARIRLRRTPTRWRVRLRPGPYELEAFVSFTMRDGRSGDTSGSFGMLVDRRRRRTIVRAPAKKPSCR
jgi:hypothetical protein